MSIEPNWSKHSSWEGPDWPVTEVIWKVKHMQTWPTLTREDSKPMSIPRRTTCNLAQLTRSVTQVDPKLDDWKNNLTPTQTTAKRENYFEVCWPETRPNPTLFNPTHTFATSADFISYLLSCNCWGKWLVASCSFLTMFCYQDRKEKGRLQRKWNRGKVSPLLFLPLVFLPSYSNLANKWSQGFGA